MKVLLRGPLLSISGYGIHSRQLFEWLESNPNIDLHVEIVRWGMTSWIINADFENGIVKRIMEKSKPLEGQEFDMSFQVQLPDEWNEKLAKINVGVTAAVETDRCNLKWVDCCNKMDAVIVPSTFTRNVIKRTGDVKTPITVIPEWYNENIDNKDLNYTEIEDLDQEFNFLSIGTLTATTASDDRKNIYNTIKWFCEEFKNDKDVGLVLKTNHGKGTKIDRALTRNVLVNTISQVRKGDYPKIHVIHGNMTQKEIAGLYRNPKIKCFLSATRGEGYGLPLVEAAASELPITVTSWSGHMDFLNKKYINGLNYNLVPIQKTKIDERIFIEGSRWADVSERDFKKKIRKMRNRHDNYQKLAKLLKKDVKQNFGKNAVLVKYNNFLNKLRR